MDVKVSTYCDNNGFGILGPFDWLLTQGLNEGHGVSKCPIPAASEKLMPTDQKDAVIENVLWLFYDRGAGDSNCEGGDDGNEEGLGEHIGRTYYSTVQVKGAQSGLHSIERSTMTTEQGEELDIDEDEQGVVLIAKQVPNSGDVESGSLRLQGPPIDNEL